MTSKLQMIIDRYKNGRRKRTSEEHRRYYANWKQKQRLKAKKKCKFCGGPISSDFYNFCSTRCWAKYRTKDPKKNWCYIGDKIGRISVHSWVRLHYIKSTSCNFCHTRPKPAKDGRTQLEWANKSGKYKRERSDWLTLCRKCHFHYDKPWLKRKRNNKGRFTTFSKLLS